MGVNLVLIGKARLAYEERCHRRQRQQSIRRTMSRRHDDRQPVQSAVGAPVNASTSVSTNSLFLNSGATPFYPHTSTSVSSDVRGSSGDVVNGGGGAAVGVSS